MVRTPLPAFTAEVLRLISSQGTKILTSCEAQPIFFFFSIIDFKKVRR